MTLEDVLLPTAIVTSIRAGSKKQALSEIAQHLSIECGLEPQQVCVALAERERLGTTAIGEGVALPHAKIDGLENTLIGFARLKEPVDFDAADDEPVDLIAALLLPNDESKQSEHLKLLSKISRRLKNPIIRQQIRGAENEQAIFAVLTQDTLNQVAA